MRLKLKILFPNLLNENEKKKTFKLTDKWRENYQQRRLFCSVKTLLKLRHKNILELKLGMEMSIISQGSELNEATKSTVRRSEAIDE